MLREEAEDAVIFVNSCNLIEEKLNQFARALTASLCLSQTRVCTS